MKVVTVGTSKIVKELIEAFKKAEIEVFACVSRDERRAESFAKQMGIARYSADYDYILDSREFDFIYLGIPNSLHYEYARKALLKGKNVIVEKPIAPDFKKARELYELAIRQRLFIFDGLMPLYNPLLKDLRNDLLKIGPIKAASFNFMKLSSKWERFKNGETITTLSKAYDGGALNDLGIYSLALVAGLFDLPKEAFYIANEMAGVDVSGCFVLKYPNLVVNGICGKDGDGPCGFFIAGEKGHIESVQSPSLFSEYTLISNGESIVRKIDRFDPYVNELLMMKMMVDYQDFERFGQKMMWSLKTLKILDSLHQKS